MDHAGGIKYIDRVFGIPQQHGIVPANSAIRIPVSFSSFSNPLNVPTYPRPQNNVMFSLGFLGGGGCMGWGRGGTGITLSAVDLSLCFIIVLRMVVTGVVSHSQYPRSEGNLRM